MPDPDPTNINWFSTRVIPLFDDPDFSNLTERWAANSNSNFSVVVVPAVDKDVVATVHFANRFHIPFLAVNRGHGDAAGLSAVDGGISIYIRNLDSIEVAEDGQSASMGGGVFQDQVVRYLFERGKVASK
ncbi:uncharacterized protein KY384_000284 [Bacidia gigantensis]|uniref:uncharacterized protein n=1 Tax=Bacidia gigantensis TaxID=2732470 RepID=UPI001D04B234|nr:uncharacterized protein KY384_000284 [Bacidia gigantensis]KAG8526291.1 hypothetical protein KY384_000284 [Bacidia gigantensis]